MIQFYVFTRNTIIFTIFYFVQTHSTEDSIIRQNGDVFMQTNNGEFL